MLYLKCPTCKEILGNRQIVFEELFDEIEYSKMSKAEKDKKKEELVNSLGLTSYCCKMRIINYVRLIDIIH